MTLLGNKRQRKQRGTSIEQRVSALENYIAMLIGTGEIADGAITTPKLLDGCVSELKVADDAVTAAKVDLAAIDALGDLASGTVDTSQLVNDAVTSLKLLNGAVTAAKTAVAGIDSSTGNISADHIIANMIQTNAITAVKINASAVTADKIATNAVTAIKINASAITADKIAANAVIASKIQANAVTADKISVSTLSAISANIGSITAGTITGVTLQTGTSGQRIVISGSTIKYYDSSNVKRIESFGGQGTISYFNSSGSLMGGAQGGTSNSSGGTSTYGVEYIIKTGSSSAACIIGLYNDKVEINNHLLPGYNDSKNLGSSSYRWHTLYAYQICLNGTCRTTWPSGSAFSCSNLSACNITHFGNPVYAYSIRAQSGGNYDLGSASYAWNTLHLKNNSSIYWNNTYYFRHNGSTFILNDELNMNSNRILGVQDPILSTDAANMNYVDNNAANKALSNLSATTAINQHLQPGVANSKYCGTSGKYWHRVYSDSYWTKNTTFQTFDKYDDLQIIRDLKFRNNKLVLSNLPKEIQDKGFINFGGMTSFNLCVSKKIVEVIDDLKNKIEQLELKMAKGVI